MTEAMLSGFFAINVKPDCREKFIEASIEEAKGVILSEDGVFQFQILVDQENPNRFYFYEVFRDQSAINTHWETEVFKTWWRSIEPMLDGAVETVSLMKTIFPSAEGYLSQKGGLSNW